MLAAIARIVIEDREIRATATSAANAEIQRGRIRSREDGTLRSERDRSADSGGKRSRSSRRALVVNGDAWQFLQVGMSHEERKESE